MKNNQNTKTQKSTIEKSKPISSAKTNVEIKFNYKKLWWLPTIIFALTTLVFFWDQLIGSSYFWEDFVEQFFPWQTFAARETAKGILPFWNPYTFVGMPFLADLQTGFFYPFNRLFTLFIDAQGNLSAQAIESIIILHFFIAQISMYYLCRFWKISFYGSVIAAISYGFSFILVLHAIHPMIVYHLSWFPLVLMFYLNGLLNKKIKYSIIAGLILGISMLAGHPQTTLYEALFLAIITIWYFISRIKSNVLKGSAIPKYFIYSIASMVIAGGIFLIQYLPSQELAKLSKRAESSYEKSIEGSLQFKQIVTSVVPKFFGYTEPKDNKVPYHLTDAQYFYYWDTGFYFGLVALILGLFAIIALKKSTEKNLLLALSIFGFLFALGGNSFIYEFFYGLPVFGSFRIPARMMFYVVLSFSVLSGFGFDLLIKNKDDKKIMTKFIIAAAIPVLFALMAATGMLESLLETPEKYIGDIKGFGWIALIFSAIITLVSILTIKKKISITLAASILIIIAYLDLNMVGTPFNKNPDNPMKKYALEPDLKKILKPNPPKDFFRVAMRMYKPSYAAMQRNQGLIDDLMLIEGYNPLVLDRVQPSLPSKDILYDLYCIKYEIAIDSVKRQPYFKERKNYFPEAWLVYNTQTVETDQVSNYMKTKNINYRNEAIVEKNLSLSLNNNIDSNAKVECVKYDNHNIIYNVKTKSNALLCMSEIWYPAWVATVDGKATDVHRANYSFRAVEVPAGEHKIELKYQSASFTTGLYITIFTFLISIISLIIAIIFEKKNTNSLNKINN